MRARPSLTALRAFSTAAELQNFTAAAQALNLSQSAVSRHIKNLEDDVGVALFQRQGRRVELTAEGRDLARVVQASFGKLEEGLDSFVRRRRDNALTVSVLPSVAAYWLSALISKFAIEHPGIDLSVHCSRSLVNFDRENVDLAIRYGQGGWPGVRSEPLMKENLIPVCAAAWAEKLGESPELSALAELPLLYGDGPEGWREYFRSAGLEGPASRQSRTTFSDDNVLMQACLSGQGFILGRGALVEQALRSGQLIAPFNHTLAASFSYWIATPVSATPQPAVEAFVSVLRREIDAQTAASARHLILQP